MIKDNITIESERMNKSISVSVILPCYNVEEWIDRCLCSIVDQTVGIDNIEVICVDDCSTDSTYDLLQEWASRYPDTIRVLRCATNARQGHARNLGLVEAIGEWIAFVDSDDWIDPDYLQAMLVAAKSEDLDMVCCGYARDSSTELIYFDDDRTEFQDIKILTEDDRRRHIIASVIDYGAWGKIIHRSFLVDNELWFPEMITYEDAAWGSLMHLYVQHAIILERKLYHYFVNESSTILKKNDNHHLDCLTAQTIAWNEYARRGFLEKYREELEVEHMFMGYLAGIKMAVLRYEKPDYNIYLLLRELVLERIPDIKSNKYYNKGVFSELHMLVLRTLDEQLSRLEFEEFASNLKKIGI